MSMLLRSVSRYIAHVTTGFGQHYQEACLIFSSRLRRFDEAIEWLMPPALFIFATPI